MKWIRKIFIFFKYLFTPFRQLPLRLLGFKNVPAVPFSIRLIIESFFNILGRLAQLRPVLNGMSAKYVIRGKESTAYSFLFGLDEDPTRVLEQLKSNLGTQARRFLLHLFGKGEDKDQKDKVYVPRLARIRQDADLNNLQFDHPEQLTLTLTSFWNIERDATEKSVPVFQQTFTNPDVASEQIYEQLSQNFGYNALLFKKVTDANVSDFREDFDRHWSEKMESLYDQGLLYTVDYRIFSQLKPGEKDNRICFTPGTFMFLEQDPRTKKLKAFAVQVSGFQNVSQEFFDRQTCTDSSWLYALQAVRTCTCVYGIFIGHLYYWHVPTAALIMTMEQVLPEKHAVRNLMEPQSEHVIGWDLLLMVAWSAIAPPTSLDNPLRWVRLLNIFADGREFFDDDLPNTLENLGIREEDFTDEKPWDRYPIVSYFQEVWDATDRYVTSFVETIYASDAAVARDKKLKKWIRDSGRPFGGNIKGLPEMNSRKNLIAVLRSFIYRITVHGGTRMINYIHPGQSYAMNYPPNLKTTGIPKPDVAFDTQELLDYLPTTGDMGDMVIFYYTFGNSAPYEPLLPVTGIDTKLYFKNADSNKEKKLNENLIQFRHDMAVFMERFHEEHNFLGTPANELQYQQWPLNIET